MSAVMPHRDRLRRLLAVLVVLWPSAGMAHQTSVAYLRVLPSAQGLALQVEVPLRALALEVDLDRDDDRALTVAEFNRAYPDIVARVQESLVPQSPACIWRDVPAEPRAVRYRDGVYADVRLQSPCARFSLSYRLLESTDAAHRGLWRDGSIVQVIAPGEQREVTGLRSATSTDAVSPAPAMRASAAVSMLVAGVEHIWQGFDHLVFLLTLLLPLAVAGGMPVDRFGRAFVPALGIVTAFTIAHSMTLALAAFGWIALPSQWVESAIAATILISAFDNLRPIFGHRRVSLAFVFGLVHGFGFANALAELDLPREDFAWRLLQFNAGVEIGQVAIVLPTLFVLYGLRHWSGYRRCVLQLGSLGCGMMALFWLVERLSG